MSWVLLLLKANEIENYSMPELVRFPSTSDASIARKYSVPVFQRSRVLLSLQANKVNSDSIPEALGSITTYRT